MASEQKRLFLALALSALVLFTWQAYFAPKTNFDATIPKKSSDSAVAKPSQNSGSATANPEVVPIQPSGSAQVAGQQASLPVQSFLLVNGQNEIKITNSFSIADYKTSMANDLFTAVVGSKNAFSVFAVVSGALRPLQFSELKVDGPRVSGRDVSLGVDLQGVLDEEGIFRWSLTSSQPYQYTFVSESEVKEGEARQFRQFLAYFKDVERSEIDDEDSFDGSMQWFGIDFHYHLFATVLASKNIASAKIKNEAQTIRIIEPTTKLEAYNIFTKKSYDDLNALGNNLHLSVDFGVFGVIAVPILKGLQFFYKYIPNYGVAIILITLLIRTLLFPLQYKSFKSMKKMQKLQPELAKVKEKYGDDPQRMQKETMELFKRNGANPMGGCLPLILQMPVFFAFYQVLFNSVELLGAPFILWINDLSVKDPYYVLPVLMGAAMFGQTKLNPSTTADPTQQKMMMFMPLIFTFFMKDLPAGLNLYIFVSTVFGILQQLFVYKTVD